MYSADLSLAFTRGYVHVSARNHATIEYGFGPGLAVRFNGGTWRNRFLTPTEVQMINTAGSAGNIALLFDVPLARNGRERLPLRGRFAAVGDSGSWLVLQDHLERALLRGVPERVVRFHDLIEGEAMRHELARLQFP
jgi:hypothetical protein